MNGTLVAYFSASGTTAKAAKRLAEAAGADIYEIRPEVAYTKADLNWLNRKSRTTLEMKDENSRPAIIKGDFDPSAYDTVFLGFPIWWYTAPTIINTFLEAYDFSGKKIVLFATSGSSGLGDAAKRLQPSAPGAMVKDGRMITRRTSDDELKAFAESVK